MDARDIKVIYLPEALDFLLEIDNVVARKLAYNIKRLKAGLSDSTVFKKLKGTDIWEFRVLYGGKCYRLLSFWDTRSNTLIVATHGFVKKTQKTPRKEIEKAEAARKIYFDNN